MLDLDNFVSYVSIANKSAYFFVKLDIFSDCFILFLNIIFVKTLINLRKEVDFRFFFSL